ncbi:MAG: YkvA family protein [Ignavibacteriaceae bacterium]
MNENYNADELKELDELDFGGETETAEKIKYIEENLWEKLERVGKKISFAKDILALVNYMRDPYVSWHRKAIVAAALVYFISPIDAVPDIAPLIGYLDDLGVITALLKFLGHELIPYYEKDYRD